MRLETFVNATKNRNLQVRFKSFFSTKCVKSIFSFSIKY